MSLAEIRQKNKKGEVNLIGREKDERGKHRRREEEERREKKIR